MCLAGYPRSVTLDRLSATGTCAGMAGAAPSPAAGRARRLAGGLGQMQLLVADQADPIETRPPVAGRRLGQPCQGVPVEPDQPFALAPADQHIEALHRYVQFERLHPLDGDAQSVVVAQIVEL